MKYHKTIAFSILAILSSIANNNNVQADRIHLTNFAPEISSRFDSFVNSLSSQAKHYAKSIVMMPDANSGDVNTPQPSSYPYLTKPSSENAIDIAKRYIEQKLNIKKGEYKISDKYVSENGVTHVYFKQYVNGLEVENGDANLNVDKFGRIISFGESFYKGSTAQPKLINQQDSYTGGNSLFAEPSSGENDIDQTQALIKLMEHLKLEKPQAEQLSITSNPSLGEDPEIVVDGVKGALSGIPIAHKYLQKADGTLEEVWDIQMEMEENWFHAHVGKKTGEILGLMDWVSDASYEVYPIGVNDPEDGNRQVVFDPADKEASPHGWHKRGKKEYDTTIGNNVVAQENLDGRTNDDYMKHYRPSGGESLKFEFPVNMNSSEPKDYLDAAVTNLFYWNNIMHDLFYKYGFTEKSGNFQHDNYGKGGKGNDEVIANAQDGAGYNNANFATPPDGKHGKMRMYVWNTADPMRDGDMESGIIIHEYGHGISTRLTGGPSNSGCLGWGESGGMGEGWGDFWATILRMRPEYTRDMNFAMGSYAANKKTGIRKYIYSTDMTVNPSTYGFIKKFDYIGVHAKGEVWAEILYEMYWNLVDKNGFSADWFNPKAKDSSKKDGEMPAGNIVALQLTVDGLKLQPCRPSFVDARDAIIQADEVNYGGEHVCELWKAFAKRGLGIHAKKGGKEDFTLPEECE